MLRLRWRALVLIAAGPAPAYAQAIDSLALREHARVLAHDSLAGRDTGSHGERLAAAYIAGELRRMGLQPLGGNSFLSPVPLLRVRLEESSRLTLRAGGTQTVFVPGADFVVSAGNREALRGFQGRVVHLPPGTAADPAHLRGAVVLGSEPPGEAMADRLRAWNEAGVAGLVLPVADAETFAAVRDAASERLVVDAAVDDPVWQPALPVIYAGPALVEALVRGIAPPRASAPLPLDRTLDADLRFHTEPLAAANVAALVPGSDAARREEVVLLTAHFDHLGIGVPVDGDSIYNGFSDNAAGVAMLLEIAGALRASPPARSVGFLFTTGEERGLLGATAWAEHPPIPLDLIVAVLNLDAGAPPAPPVRWRVAGDSTRQPVRVAAAVVERNGWNVDLTGANANSDHWPFMTRGVPAIFLVPGREWEGLSRDESARLFERWDRYHRPGDEWRPGFPLAGLQRYATLALEIVRELAN